PELHEVDSAAERRAADLEPGEVIAAQLGIGRQVAKLEREKSLHARDEIVPFADAPFFDEVGIDVAALKLLDPVPEPAAQALGMVGRLLGTEQAGQQVALQGQRRAQPVADEADLLLALLEYDDLAAPVRAEHPRLAIVELRAIALLARALPDRDAAAGAEQVVVAERDVAAKAFEGLVARAELEAPGHRLAHGDLHVPDRRLRLPHRPAP